MTRYGDRNKCKEPKYFRESKTARLVGLFAVAVLSVTPGCGSNTAAQHVHVDRNDDGYCDEDGEPMNQRGNGYSRSGGFIPYFGGIGSNTATTAPGHAATISGGSASHGGIGGGHSGGGG